MGLEVVSDSRLAALCREGEEAAWRELVRRYSRYVYAIATRGYGLGDHEAEDVFQEAFARTYERLDALRDDDALKPWLAQVTRRLAVDRLRADGRQVPVAEPRDDGASADPLLDELDAALDVRRALDRLSDECREVLDRFFARDESYATIAQALGIPTGTVASRLARCLVRLRERMEGTERPAAPSREEVTP